MDRFRHPLAPLVPVALLVACLGCLPEPEPDAPSAWHRIDLTRVAPGSVEVNRARTEPAWEARIGFLGTEEVRDMARVPEAQLVPFPKRRAGQVRVLEQRAGTRLSWPVELRHAPYASFVPLGWADRPCLCLYRFGVRDARGTIHELYRTRGDPAQPFARGVVEVDLEDFAHSRVELLMQIDPVEAEVPPLRPAGGPPPSLLWGSPALYQRAPAEPATARPERPNVLFLGLDTLRADHLGPWRSEVVAEPSFSPAIDRLAAESDVWLGAYSTFNTTNPSFASIFTGLYGKNHGVYDLQTPLPPPHETMAELFSAAGYETLAVISASHLGDHNSGLGQGFDEVLRSEHTFAAELPVDHLMGWIEGRGGRADGSPPPFFAWLHLFDPHTPHTPPEPYSIGFRPWRSRGLSPVDAWLPFRRPGERSFTEPVLGGQEDLYAGEVAYLDRQIDRLLGFLESRGLLERTLVVLVADHGENLGDHGIDFRHQGLWDTTVHVPLLVRWPHRAGERPQGRRIEGLVQTIDLFPTVLAAAGIEPPEQDGVHLEHLTGEGRRGRRVVFAEHASQAGAMARTATHKYIRLAGVPGIADGAYLYNLERDPDEETNLAGRGLPVEAELSALLGRWLKNRRPAPGTERRELDAEEREKLRALGYLD